jgi:hypothetical protein
MVFELIIVACVGLSCAGILLLVFRLFGRKAPKTLLLAVVGLSIIGFNSWNRYTWASRTEAGLPDGVTVVHRLAEPSPFEPWTYLVPQVSGLVILDGPRTRTNSAFPGLYWVHLLLSGRDEPETLELERIVDCRGARWANAGAGVALGDDGLPPTDAWKTGGEPAYLFKAVCP